MTNTGRLQEWTSSHPNGRLAIAQKNGVRMPPALTLTIWSSNQLVRPHLAGPTDGNPLLCDASCLTAPSRQRMYSAGCLHPNQPPLGSGALDSMALAVVGCGCLFVLLSR